MFLLVRRLNGGAAMQGSVSTSNLADTYLNGDSHVQESNIHANGNHNIPSSSHAPSPHTRASSLGPGVGPENLFLCLYPMMQTAVREQLPMAISR
jgi:hypothetical protein